MSKYSTLDLPFIVLSSKMKKKKKENNAKKLTPK